MRYTAILIFFFSLLSVIGWSQKSLSKQADRYFKKEMYIDAIELYNQIEGIEEKKDLLFKRGICQYKMNKYYEALEDLTQAYTRGQKDETLFYYVARSLHRLGKYEDAAAFYKSYLARISDPMEKGRIIEMIQRVGYAIDMQYEDQLAYVENIGNSVNTSYDEIGPIQSPSSVNKYYFSSDREGSTGGMRDKDGYYDEIYGKFSHDLYGVELSGGNWSSIIAFDPILNGPKNDIIQSFSGSGEVLFFIRSLDMSDGTLLTDTFRYDRPSELLPQRFQGPISSEEGDKNIFVYDDKTIFFASNRLEGYGGYDIYATTFNDSIWSEPINLGPKINSEFNEVDPFITASGTTIYFSSDRLDSYGGYDIYANVYGLETRAWNESDNLGLPINSPSNDRYYSISKDGQTGVLASDRNGTYGGYDIYISYLKVPMSEMAVFYNGLPYLNEVDVEEEEGIALADTVITEKPEEKTVFQDRKELYIDNLYYGDDENILSPSNRVTLQSIINLMKIYPKTEIMLTGNAIIDGLPAFDLYFSIKRAEKIADYLKDNGISSSRIYLKGLGPNYPIVKMNPVNISKAAKTYNRRVDIKIFPNGENVNVTVSNPQIQEGLKDDRGRNYMNHVRGLSYKVSIAKTKQMYKEPILNSYEGASIEKRADEDTYHYTFGIFSEYKKARILKNQLVRDNIINAQIVPYIDGIALPENRIPEFISKYPDLEYYQIFEE